MSYSSLVPFWVKIDERLVAPVFIMTVTVREVLPIFLSQLRTRLLLFPVPLFSLRRAQSTSLSKPMVQSPWAVTATNDDPASGFATGVLTTILTAAGVGSSPLLHDQRLPLMAARTISERNLDMFCKDFTI